MGGTTLRELNVGKYVGVRLDENQKKGLDYLVSPIFGYFLDFFRRPLFLRASEIIH
jgi:hypothetical protein